jgi:hypothetical protein
MKARFGAALVFCFAAALGCGSDDDETPSGTGGTGGGAGEAGTGGAAGMAGGTGGTSGTAGSSGGTAGAGGSAGTAGTAGTAGLGGAGGSSGGPTCTSGSDCQNDICDPATLTCMAPACDPTDYQSCAEFPKRICLEQNNGEGACYQDCVPFDGTGACGADAHCQVQSDDESLGICYYTGPNAAGQTCVPTDTGTDCVLGTVCVNFGTSSQPDRRCSTVCQVFDDGPTGCPAGDLCMVPAICLPSSLGFYDDVPVGAECTEGDYLYCGNVGSRLTGICDDGPSGGTELRCYAWCRLSKGNGDCDAGETCMDTDWENGLGVCVGD